MKARQACIENNSWVKLLRRLDPPKQFMIYLGVGTRHNTQIALAVGIVLTLGSGIQYPFGFLNCEISESSVFMYRLHCLQDAPKSNNRLGKIRYVWNCRNFFRQIYKVYRGGFRLHILQILLEYLVAFKNYNYLNLNDSSIVDKLRHSKTFHLLTAKTERFKNSFTPYLSYPLSINRCVLLCWVYDRYSYTLTSIIFPQTFNHLDL